MSVVELRMDDDRGRGSQTTDLASGAVAATFRVPPGLRNCTVCIPSVSATTTIVFKATTNVTSYNIPEDMYGTMYPRATFLGNEVISLIGLPPCGFDLSASADTGVTATLEVCAWD